MSKRKPEYFHRKQMYFVKSIAYQAAQFSVKESKSLFLPILF